MSLTPRQLEVAKGVAESKTLKEIALDLGLTVHTAEYHWMQAKRRLGIWDVAGVTRYMVKAGWVKL